jgi:soluble lytic murein transglycosylase
MRVVLFLVFLLFSLPSFGLDKKKALIFISSVKEKNFCSDRFLSLKNSDLREPVLLLYSENCPVGSNFPLPKNPYGKLAVAEKIKSKKRAREIYKEIFKKTNDLDEDVLIENLKDSKYLFSPEILRNKVFLAAKSEEIGTALFYLSYLREDPYYTYLLGYTYLKAGKKKIAEIFFKMSDVPESLFFLTYLSRDNAEKFYYYKKLMESSAKTLFKKRATVYVLDMFFSEDFGLFRRALKLAKQFPEIYNYYRARALVYTANCEELKKLKQSKTVKALEFACGVRKKWSFSKIDFYSLLINPPEKFPYKRSEIFKGIKLKDEGLKILIEKGFCSAVSFIDRPSPQNALAQFLCGNYKKGIRLAAPFKRKIKKYPFLLPVLYPKPKVFENDIYSLSIARQESLFDARALSRSGAVGLMQIMPKTGKFIAKELKEENFKTGDLYEPQLNYRFGSYYLKKLLKSFKLFPLAAAAYNCGPSRVKKLLKSFGKVENPKDLIIFNEVFVPFQETRDYVKKTYINLYYYSNLYGTGKEWKIFSSR